MKMKKMMVTASLTVAVLAVGGTAMAATTYGPFSAIVPRFGGNWYSAAHPSSGNQQVVHMGSIGGGNKIFGTVNDISENNISPETRLLAHNTTTINSYATGKQSIKLMLETSAANPVDTQCTFSWTP